MKVVKELELSFKLLNVCCSFACIGLILQSLLFMFKFKQCARLLSLGKLTAKGSLIISSTLLHLLQLGLEQLNFICKRATSVNQLLCEVIDRICSSIKFGLECIELGLVINN